MLVLPTISYIIVKQYESIVNEFLWNSKRLKLTQKPYNYKKMTED